MKKASLFVLLILMLSLPVSAKTIWNSWCHTILNYYWIEPDEDVAPVNIALIDTGIDTDSPFLPLFKIRKGKNYIDPSLSTDDVIGHGTKIAMLISGAVTDTGEIPAIAPHANLVPLVFYSLDKDSNRINGGVQALYDAILDAVDTYGCKVINLSLGLENDSFLLKKAIDYAESKGVIVVSSVGNKNTVSSEKVYYPANYATVIGVGSVDRHSEIASFSQRNSSVTVVAPGVNLTAVALKGSAVTETISGTSYSTAYVSGIAAYLLSLFPEMTPAQFREVLSKTSLDLGKKSYDTTYGYGLINVGAAIDYLGFTYLPFTDVKRRDWYYTPVRTMFEKKIAGGVSPLYFAPVQDASYAMLLTMLGRYDGIKNDSYPGFWYSPYLDWAYKNEIAHAYEFSAAAPVTRAEAALLLYRYARYKNFYADTPGDLSGFSDSDAVEARHEQALRWAVGCGILRGKGETLLDPAGIATRAEICAIFARFIKLYET